ncbi:MAG: ABC-F family ATP-binding cassette domain-containing protein [Saprospiraceae bacterium]|nr:ABC-F family ATP-binding cassette domain-containing protein [Saprospiraceae bacterium]
MITATDISVKYGDRVLLDHLDLVIKQQDRVGLVGRNGAGKSTLLKILASEINPDTGSISRPNGTTMGFLHQEVHFKGTRSVKEEAMSAFEEVRKIEARQAQINKELQVRTDYETTDYHNLLDEWSELNDRFLHLDGASAEANTEKVLRGLGFASKDLSRKTSEFSGGWQMRIELAKILLQRPDYLLLDEPTNHLDIESILWLEKFLQDYSGAVILISHDKLFLDNVTRRTLEIELGNLYDYNAAYSGYLIQRVERREKQQSAFDNQQKVIAQREKTINRFMAKATKTKMAQSMQKQLDKMERIEVGQEDTETFKLRFPPASRSGQIAVKVNKLEKSYGHVSVLQGVDLAVERADRLAFVGQNGQGKTTLAKIIVGKERLTGGGLELGHNVEIGYYAQDQSDTLDQDSTILQTMEQSSPPEMRTRLRSILGAFMFSGEDADKKVKVLSGGERARLALACLLLKPFNLLVLDEPTNHLDMLSKEVLKEALLKFDGTLLVVSHDRDFLAGLTTRTIEFRDHQLHEYLGDVNYFLEKRALDNMRAVEKTTEKVAKASVTAAKEVVEISQEERKRLLRNLRNAEKTVEKLEAASMKMELQMADPAFYGTPEAEQTIQNYQKLKRDIEEALHNWEKAQEEADLAGLE